MKRIGRIILLFVFSGIIYFYNHEPFIKAAPLQEEIAQDSSSTLENGDLLFQKLKCAGCHGKQSGGVNIPPGLEFVGSKFKRSWLGDYLSAPFRIRWQDKGERPIIRMPDFYLTQEEAGNIAAFLMQKKDTLNIQDTGIDWAQPASTEKIEHGKKLIADYACTGCHVIGTEGGKVGPDLNNVGNKLQPDYIYYLISYPDEVIPGTPMRDNQLWEDEAEAITRYLITLKENKK